MVQQFNYDSDTEYGIMQSLLLEAQKEHRNFAWLDDHSEQLLVAMDKMLYYKPLKTLAADTLLLVYKWVTVRKHDEAWNALFLGALSAYSDSEPDFNLKKMKLFLYYGRSEALLNRPERAIKLFDMGFKYAKTDKLREEYVRIYVHLFKNTLNKPGLAISPILTNHAYNLAEKIDRDHIRAAIYQGLGETFLAQFEFIQARIFCYLALRYWRKLANSNAIAQTNYILVVAYRFQEQYRRASYYLRKAKKYYALSEDWQQFVYMDYEQAAMYFAAKEFDTALSWLEHTRRELETTPAFADVPVFRASLEQLAGMIQIERNVLPEARLHLERALTIWKHIGKTYEIVNTLNSLGYLEGKDGKLNKANSILRLAEQLCDELSDVSAQEYMRNLISQNRDDLGIAD